MSDVQLVLGIFNCDPKYDQYASNPLEEVEQVSSTSSTQSFPLASPILPKPSGHNVPSSIQKPIGEYGPLSPYSTQNIPQTENLIHLKRSDLSQARVPVLKKSKIYDLSVSSTKNTFALSFKRPSQDGGQFDNPIQLRQDASLKPFEEDLEEALKLEDEELKKLQHTSNLRYSGSQKLFPDGNVPFTQPERNINPLFSSPPSPQQSKYGYSLNLSPPSGSKSVQPRLSEEILTSAPFHTSPTRLSMQSQTFVPSSASVQKPANIPQISVTSPTPLKNYSASPFGPPQYSPPKFSSSNPTSPIPTNQSLYDTSFKSPPIGSTTPFLQQLPQTPSFQQTPSQNPYISSYQQSYSPYSSNPQTPAIFQTPRQTSMIGKAASFLNSMIEE